MVLQEAEEQGADIKADFYSILLILDIVFYIFYIHILFQ